MTASLVAPDISRFLQPDPMADKYYDISPYAHDIVIGTWSASYLSPAESLSHECDHAYRAEKDLKGLVEDQSIIIPWYGNKEDLRVIRGGQKGMWQKNWES